MSGPTAQNSLKKAVKKAIVLIDSFLRQFVQKRTVCEHKRLIWVKNAACFYCFLNKMLEGNENRRTFASSSREN